MNKLHTQGKARNRIEDGQIKVIVGGQTVAIAYGQENADFITNCFNVTNECGLTPPELLEELTGLRHENIGLRDVNAELLEQRKELERRVEKLGEQLKDVSIMLLDPAKEYHEKVSWIIQYLEINGAKGKQ